MSDKWFYQRAGAVYGPVTGAELRTLVETDGILPDDLIWPESIDPVAAVRAEAAMAFPARAVEPEDFEQAPTPVPDWLPELAAVLAAVADPSSLPPPPPRDWLPDVRRLEDASRPPRTTAANTTVRTSALPADGPAKTPSFLPKGECRMSDAARALVEQMHRQAAERPRDPSAPAAGPATIPHTELPEGRPGDVLAEEWDAYRREVGRLLAEGREGQFVLIKGAEVIAVHDAWDAAREAGLRLYLTEPFLVQEIRSEEPVLRLRGYSLPCPG